MVETSMGGSAYEPNGREPIVLDVCIESVRDAGEAAAGGAGRLEWNGALELGGCMTCRDATIPVCTG